MDNTTLLNARNDFTAWRNLASNKPKLTIVGIIIRTPAVLGIIPNGQGHYFILERASRALSDGNYWSRVRVLAWCEDVKPINPKDEIPFDKNRLSCRYANRMYAEFVFGTEPVSTLQVTRKHVIRHGTYGIRWLAQLRAILPSVSLRPSPSTRKSIAKRVRIPQTERETLRTKRRRVWL